MENSVGGQLLGLGQAVIVGALMGAYYDIFRIIRRVFHCGYANVMSQDIFFFVTSAFGVFFSAVLPGNGELRVNYLLIVAVTALVYCLTVGRLAVGAISFVINGAIGIVRRVYGGTLGRAFSFAARACRKMRKNEKKSNKMS